MREKARSRQSIASILEERLAEMSPWESAKGSLRVVYPSTVVLPGLVDSIVPFLELNSNNVGFHADPPEQLSGTRRLEREVIQSLADLYHDSEADGWITAGATEGNLTGLWMARQHLVDQGCTKLAVLYTVLAHDSVNKARRILKLKACKLVPLNAGYSMSQTGLADALVECKGQGADGVIIVATVGATETGTCDLVESLGAILDQQGGMRSYLHVDAAFAGLVLPFSNPKRLFDFRVPKVSSICVDLHKMGGAPIACGAFLCRRGLSEHIRQNSSYAHVNDTTVSGSRAGATAAAAWYTIFSQGREGFRARVQQCLERKVQFIRELNRKSLLEKIIHDIDVNLAAVGFSGPWKPGLPNIRLAQDLKLKPCNTLAQDPASSLVALYRFYFMPHLTSDCILRLVSRFSRCRETTSQNELLGEDHVR